MQKGQNLWKRAKKVIPGGNMLLSKRPELFLPDKWPSYFSKAKGCRVWDLDGNEFVDMSIMGIGTNILGYGHPEVDKAVRENIEKGNMSTLNCPEEIFLAEKLIELHNWADMVRFARSGGEANAISIRIARAASGKDKIAFCGYHGWHDWYLSANLSEKEGLENHLLPGLEPNGVPRNLEGTVIPFRYNHLEELEKICSEHDLAAVKMEVERNSPPHKGFLEGVRKLCDKKNIILIFDECTSGFRETYGGLHLKYGINPDLAMFGKALGNGYAITAIIGKENIMDAVQKTFISSTFWTERIGNLAGLATLKEMKRLNSWNLITCLGEEIQNKWKLTAEEYGINISVGVIPAIASFKFNYENNLEYKTFLTREFLKRNYLASNLLFVSTEHTKLDLSEYFEILKKIFETISLRESGVIKEKLIPDNELCGETFKRLN